MMSNLNVSNIILCVVKAGSQFRWRSYVVDCPLGRMKHTDQFSVATRPRTDLCVSRDLWDNPELRSSPHGIPLYITCIVVIYNDEGGEEGVWSQITQNKFAQSHFTQNNFAHSHFTQNKKQQEQHLYRKSTFVFFNMAFYWLTAYLHIHRNETDQRSRPLLWKHQCSPIWAYLLYSI